MGKREAPGSGANQGPEGEPKGGDLGSRGAQKTLINTRMMTITMTMSITNMNMSTNSPLQFPG